MYTIRVTDKVDFSKADKAEISCYKWVTGHTPRAFAELIYVENEGFALRMTAYESNPTAIYHNYNDPVYKDSCLEFFVIFNSESGKYMNFEMNANGAFLSGVRTDRHNKADIDTLAPLPTVTPFKGEGYWGVETFFTLDFIEKVSGKKSFSRGEIIKGNFYKCGDETPIPHFGMWNEVGTEKPDFHRPEYFGELKIEE